MKAFVLLVTAAALAGCQHVATPRVVLDPRPVASSLLTCADEPEAPPATARQRDLAPYVTALAEAGQDCRRRLGTVRQVLEPAPGGV